jgi:hypothetical protein
VKVTNTVSDCIFVTNMFDIREYKPYNKLSLGNGRVSRVIGRGSRFGSRGRGSKVEVEGQKSRSRVKSRGSRVENLKFLSILKVLQPLNAAKQLVLLSKLKNFAYGYAVWLYVLYN